MPENAAHPKAPEHSGTHVSPTPATKTQTLGVPPTLPPFAPIPAHSELAVHAFVHHKPVQVEGARQAGYPGAHGSPTDDSLHTAHLAPTQDWMSL